jgi:hypothetical protein
MEDLTMKVTDAPKAMAGDAHGASIRLAQAVEAKRSLMASASRGQPVTAQELRQAEEVVRAAELEATLAAEVGKYDAAQRQRAQIAQFKDRADTLANLMVEKAAEHVAAALALDEAMAAARAAAARLDDARLALEEVDRACHSHNGLLDAEARTNPILAAQHRSTWPKARTTAALPATFGRQLRAELVSFNPGPFPLSGTGGRDEVVLRTAAQMARSAHPPVLVAAKSAA